MAEKVEGAIPDPDTKPGKDTELIEVLFSDQVVVIGGQEITVREFRFLEGLKVAAEARPIIAGLRDLAKSGTPPAEAIDQLISEHAELWVRLVARACDRDAAWVAALPDTEASALNLAFWGTNGRFFGRRLVLHAALDQAATKPSAGVRSSSISSPPDSGATNTILRSA